MKLLYQTHSPYARKVLVAAHETGLDGSLTVIHQETSPTRPNEEVFALNPLGKVPVLICDDRTVLFDSNVICEYLDGLHNRQPLIPTNPPARFRALKMQALAQGIADAGITARWESERRPADLRWPAMHDGQIQKIATACDYLEHEFATRQTGAFVTSSDAGAQTAADCAACNDLAGERRATTPASADRHPDIGDIALVTALSWIEFRRVYDFLSGRPRLAHWYSSLCARPSMLATKLEGQTHD